MEKIGKIREQIKSDINDVKLVNVDKGGLLETRVHDLQHRIETLTCDVKLRFKQVDDLLKQMQSNQAKIDMNSVLISQLFQERSTSTNEKPRARSHRRYDGSSDFRISDLDVAVENTGREHDPQPTAILPSLYGRHSFRTGGFRNSESDGQKSHDSDHARGRPVRNSLVRDFSSYGSEAGSSASTPVLPATPHFSQSSTVLNTLTAKSVQRQVASPGIILSAVLPVHATKQPYLSSTGRPRCQFTSPLYQPTNTSPHCSATPSENVEAHAFKGRHSVGSCA